jgi:tRNA A-37 threonylcarbamoyl transferase component Bud32
VALARALFWLRSLTHRTFVTENLQALEAAARAALAGNQKRVRVFTHADATYIAKRPAAKPRRLTQILFLRWAVKRITGTALPTSTLALSGATSGMDYEAGRLKRLTADGVRVPRVALLTPEFFVLEHCGAIVEAHLANWPPATWRHELPRLASELGEFHRAGHWHGGTQIKNITLRDGVSYRIDFEEDFGEFLPLPVTQAADLVLFLNSISLSGPIVESEARKFLPQLIDHYFAANPDPEIRDVIRRGLPLMKRLAGIARPFRRWSNRGIPRILILVDVFREYFDRPGRT